MAQQDGASIDEEDSEGYDMTNQEIVNMGSATKERMATAQSTNKNTTLLAEYLDADELETMA